MASPPRLPRSSTLRTQPPTLEILEDRTLLNTAPVLTVPAGPFNVVKTTQLALTFTATDKDKGETLTFSLTGAPTGMTITSTQTSTSTTSSATGNLTWTPTEDQGPVAYTFTVTVTDNGKPAKSASQQVTVTTLADGLVDNSQVGVTQPGQSLLIVGTSTNQGTATNPGNDTVSVSSTNAPNTVSVTINGATSSFTVPTGGQIITKLFGGDDSFTLNEGPVAPPLSVDGGTGTNTVTVNGTAGADAFTITGTTVGLAGAGTLTYTNAQALNVNGLGANDSFSMTGINASTVTTLDGGADVDSFTGTFAADFSGSLTLNNMESATLSVTGTVTAGSTIQGTNLSSVTIGTLAGTLLAANGSISATTITTISSTGVLQATESATVPGSGVISGTSIGTNSGSVLAGSLSNVSITTDAGLAQASGQGTTTGVSIGTNSGTLSAVEKAGEAGSGTMSSTTIGTNSGTVSAGSISGMSVTSNSGSITAAGQGTTTNVSIGTNSGSLTAVENPTEAGSGTMSSTTIGTNTGTGTVSAGSISGMSVTTNSGSITAAGQGTTTNVSIGTNSGSLTAVEKAGETGSGTMSSTTIGTNSGTVSAGSISGMSVTSNSGSITAAGAGTITNVSVGTLSGTLTATPDSTSGSGALSFATVGTLTGLISAATASNFSVTEVGGTITISSTLSDLTAGAIDSTATLSAGHFNVVTASQAAPVVKLIEPTVTRTLELTAVPGSPLPQTFAFYYDGTATGVDPVVTVQVDPGSVTNPRFDLSLLTSTEGGNGTGIDLGAVYAKNNQKGGFRNVVVAGDVRPSAANPGFFSLPAGTPGGVQLPQDTVAVAAAGDLPAASVATLGVTALAFNTVAGVSSAVAKSTDAQAALAPGTALVQAADTYDVFVGAGKPVVQFVATGPGGGSFDNKSLSFTDQLADGLPVTAATTFVLSGSSLAAQDVTFTGNRSALTTAQPITATITNASGSLGDLILSAPGGITANVTAASIAGNVEATNGAISGTIETTAGDFGLAFTDSTGTITGVTIVSTGGGGITSTGRLISAGNLVSQINVQSGMDGVIAAEGDIGVIQRDANGNAVMGSTAAKALTRFGGITVSNGGLNGQVVALGNIFGDISLTGGLSGRIAANGKVEYGLGARFGILGNVSISGGIDTNGAIVSAGVLGDDGSGNVTDDTLGTQLTISGKDKGILAAEGDINFGTTGSLNQSGLFESASGVNKQAIDAIFTDNNVLLTIPAGLDKILADLAALTVNAQGNLSGTTP